MRLERSVVGGITFINDAYNANPESAIAAIRTFAQLGKGASGRRVVVLGDMLELGEAAPDLHREVGRALAASGAAEVVVLVGEYSRGVADVLGGSRSARRVQTHWLAEADVERAAGLLRAGDLVLLKGSRRMGLERIIKAVSLSSAGASGAGSGGAEASAAARH
jgi:UDP-N-acetylmuramoyl-tripeptide--D-alanyl-D-alanine ligase